MDIAASFLFEFRSQFFLSNYRFWHVAIDVILNKMCPNITLAFQALMTKMYKLSMTSLRLWEKGRARKINGSGAFELCVQVVSMGKYN